MIKGSGSGGGGGGDSKAQKTEHNCKAKQLNCVNLKNKDSHKITENEIASGSVELAINGGNSVNKKDTQRKIKTSCEQVFNNANVKSTNINKNKNNGSSESIFKNNARKKESLRNCNNVAIKWHSAMQSTVILLSWLFVFMVSILLIYFTNANSNFFVENNNAIVKGEPVSTFVGNLNAHKGTEDDPHLISNYADLCELANIINGTRGNSKPSGSNVSYNQAYYKLQENIETSLTDWVPIGKDSSNLFQGVFDGNDKSIIFKNKVTISSDVIKSIGIFGIVGWGSSTNQVQIKNLNVNWEQGLEVSSTTDTSSAWFYVGGIVGQLYEYCIMENCSSNGKVSCNLSASSIYVGGMVGYSSNSIIKNCLNYASVTSSQVAGGVVGMLANKSQCTNCSNFGEVIGGVQVGGVIGNKNAAQDITYCNNKGNVKLIYDSSIPSSRVYAGGVIGTTISGNVNSCGNEGEITAEIDAGSSSISIYVGGIAGSGDGFNNCYNKGEVGINTSSGMAYVSGIVGSAVSTTISNCYNLGFINANSTGTEGRIYLAGIVGDSNSASKVNNCYNKGNLSVISNYALFVGGIAGETMLEITKSYNNGQITIVSTSQNICLGGIVGESRDVTKIISCYNTGLIFSNGGGKYIYVGGIVGSDNNSAQIENCYNIGEVKAASESDFTNMYVGGIVGRTYVGTISNSYNKGKVTASGSYYVYVGGIAGEASITSNCYNTGAVNANADIGPIRLGGIIGSAEDTISNCYNTGAVSGTVSENNSFVQNFAGIVGVQSEGSIINCFSLALTINGVQTPSPTIMKGDVTKYGNAICGSDDADIKNCYHNYSSLSNSDGTYVEKLSDYLVCSSINQSDILKKYQQGFGKLNGDGSYEFEWYSDETGTEDYAWDFNTVWAIDMNENDGLPYFAPQVINVVINSAVDDKFLIVIQCGDNLCGFTYSGEFSFEIDATECKISIIGYSGVNSLSWNGTVQTVSDGVFTISIGDSKNNNIEITLGGEV